MRIFKGTSYAIFIAIIMLSGCETPQYNIRRVAMVPGPYIPARSGRVMEPESYMLQLEANPLLALRPENVFVYSEIGDAGLQIAYSQLGGSFYLSSGENVEIGMQTRYAFNEWTEPTAWDVPDFPEDAANGVSLTGVGMRYKNKFEDEDFYFSAILEMNLAVIPEATYVKSNGYWEYQGCEREQWLFPALFFQLDYLAPQEYFDIYGFLGIEGSVTNEGFDLDSCITEEYTVEPIALYIMGAGLDIKLNPMYLAGGAYVNNSEHYPSSQPSLSFFARVGFEF